MFNHADLMCSETLVEDDDLSQDARLDTRGSNVVRQWRITHAHGTQPTAERGALEGGTNASPAKGRGGRGRRAFLPFEAARAAVRTRKLRSRREWRAWSSSEQRPSNIPGCPHVMYRDAGWISEQDWLGYSSRTTSRTTSRTASQTTSRTTSRTTSLTASRTAIRTARRTASRSTMLPFAAARAIVRKLKLRSRKEWRAWCTAGNRPPNIPAAPRHTYHNNGWISIPDWLGYNNIRKGKGMHERPLVRRQSLPTLFPSDIAAPTSPTSSPIASVWPGDTLPAQPGGHQHESITACGAGEYDWSTGAAELAEGNGDHNVCAMDSHWRNVELELDSSRPDLVLAECTLALSEAMVDISS